MSYYTTEIVSMKADNDVCEELKKWLEPEFTDAEDSECEIENGEFYCRFYGSHIVLEELLIDFTKEHKNILVEHSIHDWETGEEFDVFKLFYKNGKSKYIEPVWPAFDMAKEFPDID